MPAGRPALVSADDKVEVPIAVHPGFPQAASEYLSTLTTGDGVPLSALLTVEALSVYRTTEAYELSMQALLMITVEGAIEPLVAAHLRVRARHDGSPYAAEELESIHQAIGLQLLERFFADPKSIAHINEQVSSASPTPLPQP